MVDGTFDNLTVNTKLKLNLNSNIWDQVDQRLIIQAYHDRMDILNLAGNAFISKSRQERRRYRVIRDQIWERFRC